MLLAIDKLSILDNMSNFNISLFDLQKDKYANITKSNLISTFLLIYDRFMFGTLGVMGPVNDKNNPEIKVLLISINGFRNSCVHNELIYDIEI